MIKRAGVKLVDVTGIEPVTPLLANWGEESARKIQVVV
jgi:hypothetical protein